MTTAKFEEMKNLIRSGWTMQIITHYRCLEISPKTFFRWEKNGVELFKNNETETGFYVRRGNNWDYVMSTVPVRFVK